VPPLATASTGIDRAEPRIIYGMFWQDGSDSESRGLPGKKMWALTQPLDLIRVTGAVMARATLYDPSRRRKK
jgi:hypothetical protein